MLTLYSPDRRYLHDVSSAIPGGEPTTLLSDWKTFAALSGAGTCSIAIVPWLAVDRLAARLAGLKHQLPLQPMVVATSKDADNVRMLKDVRPDEIVWIGELVEALWPAVQRASGREFRQRLATALRTAAHMDPLLRGALASACRQDQPVLSVHHLASLAGCDRRTLWRHWRQSFAAPAPLRLEDLLRWLLLLHAVVRKRPHHAWSEVALELGVHEHTLGRYAAQLVGLGLRDLASAGARELEARFAVAVLAPMLRRT